MVLVRLRVLTSLKERITVFAMTMVLMQMKHGCMGTGFIRKAMVFLVIEEKQQNRLPHTILDDR